MSVNSNAKGKRGELEACRHLEAMDFAGARRTAQFNGKSEHSESDVICDDLPGVHIEVKRGSDPGQYLPGSAKWKAAVQQAIDDSRGKSWCVLHKTNRSEWLLTCPWRSMVVTIEGKQNQADALRELTEATNERKL